MSIIQIALTAGIIFIAFYMYTRMRNNFLDTLMIFAFLFVGVLVVLFPESTNKVAHWFGVARGIHLLFYLGFLFLFFLILKLYAKIKRLDQKLTEFVRREAIRDAESGVS